MFFEEGLNMGRFFERAKAPHHSAPLRTATVSQILMRYTKSTDSYTSLRFNNPFEQNNLTFLQILNVVVNF